MKKLVFIFILFFLSKSFFGTGCNGIYYIKGTAYDKNNTILKKTTLTITFRNETKTVITDENGGFEIEIKWVNSCSATMPEATMDCNARNQRLNPKIILIKYLDQKIEVENTWYKYSRCAPKSKKQLTRMQDLNFQ